MEASVKLHAGMHFTGTADSGFIAHMGSSPKVGGANDGFRPMELLAVSLCGCTGMDVISILRKMRQDVTDFEVRFHGERTEEHPKVFTEITLEYMIAGRNLDVEKVERAIELSAVRYCPVQAMLQPTVKINHTYVLIDAEE